MLAVNPRSKREAYALTLDNQANRAIVLTVTVTGHDKNEQQSLNIARRNVGLWCRPVPIYPPVTDGRF